MKALIDGDIVLYGCGFAAQHKVYEVNTPDGQQHEFQYKKEAIAFMEKESICDGGEFSLTDRIDVEPLANALHNIQTKIEAILEGSRANTFVIYLTGGGNFRDSLVSDYKANRDPAHKPVHYKECKKFMLEKLGAVLIEGEEADDAMAIEQCQSHEETVICTKDKDLKMVPGNHYHLDSKERFTVDEREGQLFFYKQIITGDATDNIAGLFRLTNKKATKKVLDPLDEILDEPSMWEYVKSLFVDIPEQTIVTNARLLWMRREENQMWTPPTPGEWK